MDRDGLMKYLKSIREKDAFYEDGKVLSSMCSKPDAVGVDAFNLFVDANLLDEDLFHNAKKLEGKTIKRIGSLLSAKKASGCMTSGSTEGNLTALWVARKIRPGLSKVMIPESAHYSLAKITEIMGLKPVHVPLDGDMKADMDFIRDNLDESCLACVLTAGTTEFGVVDPIKEAARICRKNGVFLHVDAAYGGFIIPFLRKAGYLMPEFDFKLKGVCSITSDPHKMGLAPIPAGTVLFRDDFLGETTVKPEYLPNNTSGFLGTKSAGPAAASYALLEYYGFEGYSEIVVECMKTAELLFNELEGLEGVEPVMKPVLPIVCFKLLSEPESIHHLLESKGWRINFNRKTGHFRVVVMPHVTREVVRNFVSDLAGCLS